MFAHIVPELGTSPTRARRLRARRLGVMYVREIPLRVRSCEPPSPFFLPSEMVPPSVPERDSFRPDEVGGSPTSSPKT